MHICDFFLNLIYLFETDFNRMFFNLIFGSVPESSIAPYLTTLHKRLASEGIRVGSYPLLQRGVTVSLIGRDEERIREIGQEASGVSFCWNSHLLIFACLFFLGLLLVTGY